MQVSWRVSWRFAVDLWEIVTSLHSFISSGESGIRKDPNIRSMDISIHEFIHFVRLSVCHGFVFFWDYSKKKLKWIFYRNPLVLHLVHYKEKYSSLSDALESRDDRTAIAAMSVSFKVFSLNLHHSVVKIYYNLLCLIFNNMVKFQRVTDWQA